MGSVPFNPLHHPICLEHPLRLAPSTWIQHVPFGMFLVDALRPGVIVELGTHYGVSYCAFCQAVKQLETDTRCYAVDTWEGDAQAGFYGPEVFADLRRHHDPLYGTFSQLIQGTFDDAVGQFTDHSIDLLHIDGCHTLERVRHDFETWLPKVSPAGVVLLHDICVRRDDFGVWRLWEELKGTYRTYELHHGYGLGVIFLGEPSGPFEAVFDTPAPRQARLHQLFFALGMRLQYALDLQRQQTTANDKSRTIAKLPEQPRALAAEAGGT